MQSFDMPEVCIKCIKNEKFENNKMEEKVQLK